MSHATIHCHECNACNHLRELTPGNKALCFRCGYRLSALRVNWINRALALNITSAILLLVSLPFTYLSFSANGLAQSISLLSSLDILTEQGYPLLSAVVFVCCAMLPMAVLGLSCALAGSVKYGWRLSNPKFLIDCYFALIPWCMAEIFIIGVLVSLVKIVSMAEVEPGIAFYTYILFSLSFLMAVLQLDKHQLQKALLGDNTVEHSGIHSISIQRTWALLLASVILYIPANTLPIMTTRFLGSESPATIMAGVVLMWEQGSYPVAAVIFIASIFVPVVKMLILFWLNLSVQRKHQLAQRERLFWYRITEFIGRWSMVDVFVVAVLVSLVQLGNTMSIYPGPAILAFCGVVVLSMLAALTFDSRLLWANSER